MADDRYSVAQLPLKWFLWEEASELRNSDLRRRLVGNYLVDDRYSETFVENLDPSFDDVQWLQAPAIVG